MLEVNNVKVFIVNKNAVVDRLEALKDNLIADLKDISLNNLKGGDTIYLESGLSAGLGHNLKVIHKRNNFLTCQFVGY